MDSVKWYSVKHPDTFNIIIIIRIVDYRITEYLLICEIFANMCDLCGYAEYLQYCEIFADMQIIAIYEIAEILDIKSTIVRNTVNRNYSAIMILRRHPYFILTYTSES